MINSLLLLTAKPVIYLVNLSERDYARKKNKWLPKIKQWIDENNPGDQLIPFSAALEEQLFTISDENELKEYLAKLGEGVQSALPKITKSGYDALDLIRYFTAGPDEVRAWSIRRGVKAPQAAGVIHSDFENKFVCGEIMAFNDLKEAGSENACRANGKLVQKGKTYEMVDGDIAQYVLTYEANHTAGRLVRRIISATYIIENIFLLNPDTRKKIRTPGIEPGIASDHLSVNEES